MNSKLMSAGVAALGIVAIGSGYAAQAPRGAPSGPPQMTGESIEWRHLGGPASHTRYSPAKQIDASNFETLKTAWVWDGGSFKAQSGRSTPSYANGKLYTVAGERRYVVAIDPATGETIWSYA